MGNCKSLLTRSSKEELRRSFSMYFSVASFQPLANLSTMSKHDIRITFVRGTLLLMILLWNSTKIGTYQIIRSMFKGILWSVVSGQLYIWFCYYGFSASCKVRKLFEVWININFLRGKTKYEVLHKDYILRMKAINMDKGESFYKM